MDKESSSQGQRRRKQRGTNIETIGSRVQENSRAAVLILDAVQFGGLNFFDAQLSLLHVDLGETTICIY